MRYYIIAGERSGDLHGSNLVKAIRRLDPLAQFKGIGGELMQQAGVELLLHYGKMAFMGFLEVLANLNTISKFVKMCRRDVLQYKPDAVILIDYAGFNRQMASFCKRNGIRVLYYISPKVWAWHQRRAWHLKKNVDRMFVILPFEKDFYKKFNWEVDYVGNPVLDAIKNFEVDNTFTIKYNLQVGKPVVALLPGSRRQELQRILPVMAEVARKFPQYHFAVAMVGNLERSLYGPMNGLENVTFISDDTYNLLRHANAAIVTSGTATLETALFKVPQVVVYKTSTIGYAIAKSVVSVPYISLVNLIAGKQVIMELIQHKATLANISAELSKIIDEKTYRGTILDDYDNILRMLDTGSASENAARLMVQYLKGS